MSPRVSLGEREIVVASILRDEKGMRGLLALPIRAGAAPIPFDFNALSAGINSTAGADRIETYMEGLYGSDVTVNLGAQTRKNRVENRPRGLCLGNADGALDRGPFGIPRGHPDPKDTLANAAQDFRRRTPGPRPHWAILFKRVL